MLQASLVAPGGRVVAQVPCPIQAKSITGRLDMRYNPRRPWDRWLPPVSVALSVLFIVWRFGSGARTWWRDRIGAMTSPGRPESA